MANYIVNATDMLNPQKLDKLDNWHRLNTNSWADDSGLIDKLEQRTRLGHYFVNFKSSKKLWDLLTYCGPEPVPVICEHYGYPNDIVDFIRWTYNKVAVNDTSWQWEVTLEPGQETWEERLPQNDWFPYEQLYNAYWKLKIDKNN